MKEKKKRNGVDLSTVVFGLVFGLILHQLKSVKVVVFIGETSFKNEIWTNVQKQYDS